MIDRAGIIFHPCGVRVLWFLFDPCMPEKPRLGFACFLLKSEADLAIPYQARSEHHQELHRVPLYAHASETVTIQEHTCYVRRGGSESQTCAVSVIEMASRTLYAYINEERAVRRRRRDSGVLSRSSSVMPNCAQNFACKELSVVMFNTTFAAEAMDVKSLWDLAANSLPGLRRFLFCETGRTYA